MRDGMLETDGKSECSHLLHMHVFQTGWMDSAEAGCKGSGFSDLFQSLGVHQRNHAAERAGHWSLWEIRERFLSNL